MQTDDLDLLRRYALEGSEGAFAEVVHRHLNFVYATALRSVKSPQMAEEIAQAVFLKLAQNAARLTPGTILAAWLYRVTRHAAVDALRGEFRRQARDQTAFEIANMKADASESARIEPLLDEALEQLGEPDRNAILLRYFEEKSLREVGQAMGTSEEAARKRVGRAVEELRSQFSQRGMAVGIGALATILAAQAASAAPAGLGGSITAAALAGNVAQHTATFGTTKAIVMTLWQKALVTAALAAAVGAGLYGAREAAQAREQVTAFRQSQAALEAQNRELQKDRDSVAAKLASLQTEPGISRSNQAELLRLRGEVGRLREKDRALAQTKTSGEAADPMSDEMKSWLDRVKQLKERIELAPEAKIPEFQFLTDQDWLEAVRKLKSVDSPSDFRSAVRSLQNEAKSEFASALQHAMNKYAEANGGQSVSDFAQLTPYFQAPLDDSLLQNYRFSEPGTVANKTSFEVDPDGNFSMSNLSVNSKGISSGTTSGDELKQAIGAYSAANNGQKPTDPTQLIPFVQTPEEKTMLQQVLGNLTSK